MSLLRRAIKTIEPHPGEHFKDKAIAVALALIVWVSVNTEEIVPEIFDQVPIEVTNLPEALAIAGPYEDTLYVRLLGSQRNMERLTPGRLSPTLDLSGAAPGEMFFDLLEADLNLPAGVTAQDIRPAQIRILLETRVERSVPVSPVTSGEPALGYEVVGKATMPLTALVSGPRSAVDALERITTSTVDVTGLRESFDQTVTLVTGNSLVELTDARTVEMSVDILEQAITEQFENIPVVVINTAFRVAVNPTELTIALRGPPSLLQEIDIESLQMVVDAEGLQPRAEDYRIAPTVRFGLPEFGDLIELVAIYPQRLMDVHVFDQPSRQ